MASKHTPNRRSRAARFLAGAIAGGVLTMGAGAGSASAADDPEPVVVESPVQKTVQRVVFSRLFSGIRW